MQAGDDGVNRIYDATCRRSEHLPDLIAATIAQIADTHASAWRSPG